MASTISQGALLNSPLAPPPIADKEAIRILLVDDHPIVRIGLRTCLRNYPQLRIVGEADNGWDALRLAKTLSPDVVVLDLEMPRLDGLAATSMLRQEVPSAKVLILSMHHRNEQILGTLRAGASGYLLKDAPILQLVKAIEVVFAGGTCFRPEIASLALNQVVLGAPTPSRGLGLSRREREVLIAIAEGLSASETGQRLGVSLRTVQTHRERIRAKLNIRTVAGLTVFAVENALIAHPKELNGE